MHSSIVLDINSGSIGGGVVLMRKHLPPALLYQYRTNFYIEEGLEPAELYASRKRHMKKTLDQVLRKVVHEGLEKLSSAGKVPRKPDHILVTLSSVWEPEDLDIVEDEITKVLGSNRGICVKDFIFVLSHTLGITGQNDTLISSISGGVTESIEASALGNARPECVKRGPETVVQSLARELGIDKHIARSLVAMYSEATLLPERRSEIEGIVAREMEKWRLELFETTSAQKTRRIHLFVESKFAHISGRVLKSTHPGAEIVLERHEPLEILTAFSNSLL